MTLTIEVPDLVGARIQETPEAQERARAVLTREFAGIDLEAVTALRESFAEEGGDVSLEEAIEQTRAKILARKKSA